MRIGVMIWDTDLDKLINKAKDLEERGFDSVWLSNVVGQGFEPLTAISLIARETERIKLGTAIVSIYHHHPAVLAHQAISIQMASQGRFTLGVGLSHKVIVEDMLGFSYKNLLPRMAEYLSILRPLLKGESVNFSGTYYSADVGINMQEITEVPLLVAALGPRMLRLAGEMTDGTVTYLAGPRTLETHIIPGITSAAREFGNPAPRIAAGGIPIAIVKDKKGAYAAIAEQFEVHGELPAYKALFEREGVANASEMAFVGDADTVKEKLDHLAAIGVTELIANPVDAGEDAVDRTIDFLSGLL